MIFQVDFSFTLFLTLCLSLSDVFGAFFRFNPHSLMAYKTLDLITPQRMWAPCRGGGGFKINMEGVEYSLSLSLPLSLRNSSLYFSLSICMSRFICINYVHRNNFYGCNLATRVVDIILLIKHSIKKEEPRGLNSDI